MHVIYIRDNEPYSSALKYILGVFAKNRNTELVFADTKTGAHLVFDHEDPGTFPVNTGFYDSLLNSRRFGHSGYFTDAPYIRFGAAGNTDYLGTAFYMINCFQEYQDKENSNHFDGYGRFSYQHSYQSKFNCITRNIVQSCFDNFARESGLFAASDNHNTPVKVFLSHDIDTVYGSLLQDGLWAIKRHRYDILMTLIMNEVLRKPHWLNIDKIVRLHSEYDLKSTFFWLATKKTGPNGIKNADYDIRKLSNQLTLSDSHGLHKSCNTSGFREELALLPAATALNRYHFLKFTLPSAWDDIESAGIKLDASLGFADHYGFRNSYGLPFRPFNIATRQAYNFVEVPLNIMDGTLHRYMNVPLEETAGHIISFIENNRYNTILSLLWHNTYFTNYKYSGYLGEYKKVLVYLYESGIESITPKEIIHEYAQS